MTLSIIIAALLRHILTVIGGSAIATGAIDQDMITTGAGAISALIGLGWSFYEKKTR